ncbi:MAG: aspartate-semialdehyde dehydrogenase [Clostridia bacterium]|nr:aspartate-semialdehyde dehydrogenase [Clostridia bacterium]
MSKMKVGVIGATGMVGQRFLTLLENHPFFEVAVLAAGPRSAGKSYKDAVEGRWKLSTPMPAYAADMLMYDATADMQTIGEMADFVFCAVDMPKDQIRALEEAYAKAEIPVVSNNSAHRGTPDVPMVIPEINSAHLEVIEAQKKRLGTKRGFIAVKPNCSIQSYVPMLTPLLRFGIKEVSVCTYQAISGAGKTFDSFPEILDNVIPYIGGEEEKSEKEPLKIWGTVENGEVKAAQGPVISAQCLRVPVSDGHTAAVSVSFENTPTEQEILAAWANGDGFAKLPTLPSAPKQFVHYLAEDNRPQAKLDRDCERGMAVSVGRLRKDNLFDYKFVGLSHNTLRGAAGGAVLIAELLYTEGYFNK